MLLKVLFFIPACVALLYEMWSFERAEVLINLRKKTQLSKKDKSIKFTSVEMFFAFCMMLYALWGFVGLLSSQCFSFVMLFLLGFLVSLLKKSILVTKIDAVLSIIILLFMIFNTFQFHINIGYEILNFCLGK